MDTLRYGYLNKTFLFTVIFCVFIILAGPTYPADNNYAAQILAKTYNNITINPDNAESIVQNLEKALSVCDDDYLTYRIKYRMGVIYFKANLLEKAKRNFNRIIEDTNCPELTKISALNMIGQISRLEGNNQEALRAYNKTVELVERNIPSNNNNVQKETLMQILSSALIGSAEIYELQLELQQTVESYNYFLLLAEKYKTSEILRSYTPLVRERISKLYLKLGDIDRFIESAQAIILDYPQYYRIPIIKLESECIKYLIDAGENKFKDGSYSLPAMFISVIKNSENKDKFQLAVDNIKQLSEKDEDTYGTFVIKYHYAWLLDALGEKTKALEIFKKLSSFDINSLMCGDESKAVALTLQQYSKIQYAIMAGEKADYKEASGVLSTLGDSDNPHISEIIKTVTESIQILKREVPANENSEK